MRLASPLGAPLGCRDCFPDSCSFVTKVQNALAIGARGVIIVNEDTGGVLPLVAGAENENHKVDVPVCMVSFGDGERMSFDPNDPYFVNCEIVPCQNKTIATLIANFK